MKKLQTLDSIYFRRTIHFEADGTQNYSVFEPMHKYFKRACKTNNHILSWKSKGLSDESIKSPSAPNNFDGPLLDYLGHKIKVKISGSCLKQDKLTYTHGKIVNICIVYEISKNYSISSYSALENCLFSAVSLTKTADIDKFKYSGCGIGFDRHGFFSHPSGGLVEM